MTGLSNPASLEVEPGFQQAAPRRQISNLSLPKKKSEISGACSNMVNSIVGAGIIGIPFAFRESGLISGIVLLFLVSYFTGMSLWWYEAHGADLAAIVHCFADNVSFGPFDY